MPSYTRLNGVNHVADALSSDMLEANLIGFFQWAFLGVGGFFNVTRGQLGPNTGDQSQLRPVTDPNYVDGQVWEAFRKDWVWESGVEYAMQPIHVSGVYINGGFLPVNSGITVDYPNGRVILDNPIPQSSVMQAEYSYRLFQMYTSDNPTWGQIQVDSFQIDNSQFMQTGSGAWDILAQNRIQLPAIFVEAVPNVKRTPLMIGGGVRIHQSVMFHIIAEERYHMKWLHDAITAQWQKKIHAFDKNALLLNDAFPLNGDGTPNPSGLMYPALVDSGNGYYWDDIYFFDSYGVEQPKYGQLWYCSVRSTMELNRPEW